MWSSLTERLFLSLSHMLGLSGGQYNMRPNDEHTEVRRGEPYHVPSLNHKLGLARSEILTNWITNFSCLRWGAQGKGWEWEASLD